MVRRILQQLLISHVGRWVLAAPAVALLLVLASTVAGWQFGAPGAVTGVGAEAHTGPAYGPWDATPLAPAEATLRAAGPNGGYSLGQPLGPEQEALQVRRLATVAHAPAGPLPGATAGLPAAEAALEQFDSGTTDQGF